jgi:hypothetical protein
MPKRISTDSEAIKALAADNRRLWILVVILSIISGALLVLLGAPEAIVALAHFVATESSKVSRVHGG